MVSLTLTVFSGSSMPKTKYFGNRHKRLLFPPHGRDDPPPPCVGVSFTFPPDERLFGLKIVLCHLCIMYDGIWQVGRTVTGGTPLFLVG